MTDDVQLSITLDHSASHFPGDRVKGQVSVISTTTARITNLRLVWRGVVITEMNTNRDENTFFREVWYLDPKGSNTFVLIPAPSEPHKLKVKKGIKDYSFDLYLKRNVPSSFEMNETVAMAKVEYVLEAWAEIDGSSKPKRERIHVPVLATQQHQDAEAEEQQTRDATYIVTIPEVDKREYRTAARITVPCRIAQRAVALPIVAHIWHERDCSQPGGITLSLLRMTTISCHHRKETLIREIETTTLDLELVRRPEYSVQMLSESLRIPSTTLPSLEQSIGRLVMIEYRISLKVTIHDNAIYRLPEDRSIAPNMLVDLPLMIDSNEIPDSVKPQSTSTSIHSTTSSVSNRMRNMFRRRSNNPSLQPTANSNYATPSGSGSRTGRQTSIRSSSPSISSITTDSLPTKPIPPPPFTSLGEEQRPSVKSTPVQEFDTGVYTFHMFEELSDEEYVPMEEDIKPNKAQPSSSASQKETPAQAPSAAIALPEIPTTSSSSDQYWGIFADQDSENEDDVKKQEPKSPSTTATTPTPMSPSSSRSAHVEQYHVPTPQHTEAANSKLDFISESDTDDRSDDSDEEPDLLSVVARREQRIERQKRRSIIPSA